MNTQQQISWLALALRWTARVAGLLLVGLVFIFNRGLELRLVPREVKALFVRTTAPD